MWCNRVQVAGWTTEETKALIGVWGEANVQELLDIQLENPRCVLDAWRIGVYKHVISLRSPKFFQIQLVLISSVIGTDAHPMRIHQDTHWMRIESSASLKGLLSTSTNKLEVIFFFKLQKICKIIPTHYNKLSRGLTVLAFKRLHLGGSAASSQYLECQLAPRVGSS